MIIKEFAQYLINLSLVPNSIPIKAALLRSDEKTGIMVMTPLLGFMGATDFGKFYIGELQIIVRAANPELGYEYAKAIHDGIPNTIDLDNYSIKQIHPKGLPITYPLNIDGLYEHSINFYCAFYEK